MEKHWDRDHRVITIVLGVVIQIIILVAIVMVMVGRKIEELVTIVNVDLVMELVKLDVAIK